MAFWKQSSYQGVAEGPSLQSLKLFPSCPLHGVRNILPGVPGKPPQSSGDIYSVAFPDLQHPVLLSSQSVLRMQLML